MATTLKLRGGTTTQHASFTGAAREVTVDTTDNRLVVHDGSTAGGFPLALASEISASGGMATDFSNIDANADGYVYKNTLFYYYTGSNQTYTAPSDVRGIMVEMVGGGGGGGSAYGYSDIGGCGAAGGYLKIWLTFLSNPMTIEIGAGGAGGAVPGASGADGGTTRIALYHAATGGKGGPQPGVVTFYRVQGGIGSSIAGPTYSTGAKGQDGTWHYEDDNIPPMKGGASFFGGGGSIGSAGSNGSSDYISPDNRCYGSGGGGGHAPVGGTGFAAGGDGMPGCMIIHEYM